ncbi:MAG TPA: gephyrin-like molybdotransferase Glp [Terriglobales bacterium]|jgi:molybdopterin molybdotransferase|nr:gephyrin-like molybdotransferase Glp [Terriglobales bacterium]
MAHATHNERVLSFEEARRVVEEAGHGLLRTRRPSTEKAGLLNSAGRVLAEEIAADRDFPPFNRATRDGFAVRAADVLGASDAAPLRLRVVGETKAGASPYGGVLKAGEALEIMTGAPAPAGSEYAVVMVEHTSRQGNEILVRRAVKAGENIVAAGSEARKGAVLLAPGHRIDHAAIAVAASVGRTQVEVYGRPRIAILSTGDEIVEINAMPQAHQIRNSNSYSLAAQVAAAGGEAVQFPIAADNISALRGLVQKGLESELLLLSGGVSMGKYDLVEQALTEFGAEFLFTGARIQPGKPIVFGRVSSPPGQTVHYFFGLPGNPVSTMVTFELFAKPMIDALGGTPPALWRPLQARLKSEITTKTGLTRFLPGFLSGLQVETVRWLGSGDIVATAQANCYVVVPPDRETLPAGEMVEVLLRRRITS